ncbi:MAG: radical SAM protein, partial [Myxococcales bacterium]|nr:radical SAM protein [Myxococcales bacterium]
QLEPRASQPKRRLLAIEQLSGAGIPLCVNVAPIIPGLNDHEIPQILKRAKEAGAKEAFYTMVRLPYGVKDIFSQWLERYFPDRKDKVIHRIQEVRGGQLNVSTFGDRMIGVGPYAEHIAQMFNRYRKLYQLDQKIILSIKHFKRESREQLSLFE